MWKLINEEYRNKIGRNLYKVNGEFNVNDNIYQRYRIVNLKDITSSFLVSANIVLGICRENGINNLSILSILIERWDVNMLVNDYHKKDY